MLKLTAEARAAAQRKATQKQRVTLAKLKASDHLQFDAADVLEVEADLRLAYQEVRTAAAGCTL